MYHTRLAQKRQTQLENYQGKSNIKQLKTQIISSGGWLKWNQSKKESEYYTYFHQVATNMNLNKC